MNFEKALKKSISLPEGVLIEAEKKAREQTNGNLSQYIQTLINRDVGSSPALPTERNSILEDLAERWTPTFSEALAFFLEEREIDQIEMLGRLLACLLDYLASHDCRRSADFVLVPREKVATFAAAQHGLSFIRGKQYRLMESGRRDEQLDAEAEALAQELAGLINVGQIRGGRNERAGEVKN